MVTPLERFMSSPTIVLSTPASPGPRLRATLVTGEWIHDFEFLELHSSFFLITFPNNTNSKSCYDGHEQFGCPRQAPKSCLRFLYYNP